MKYYDHYILAQGGIHNITAFAVAFNFKFSPPPHLFWCCHSSVDPILRIYVSSSDDLSGRVQHVIS